MAVALTDETEAIYVWDVASHKRRQLTFGRGGDFGPVWMTDSKRLIFRRTVGIFSQHVDGTGTAQDLGTGVGIPTGVAPDGTQALFNSGGNIMVLALDGTKHVTPLITTPANERNAVVSPNGRWVAYESDREGRFDIYVAPYPDVNASLNKVSTGGGTRPLWSPTGAELFYVAPDGALMALALNSRASTLVPGSLVKVVDGPYSTGNAFSPRNYDVSRDGKQFLMVKKPLGPAAVPQVVVRLNWRRGWFRLLALRTQSGGCACAMDAWRE